MFDVFYYLFNTVTIAQHVIVPYCCKPGIRMGFTEQKRLNSCCLICLKDLFNLFY